MSMSDAPLPSDSSSLPKQRWLTLKEASDFLGIHYTTLRAWADQGQLRVFRTPGGHRRFSAEDLRRFLEERAGRAVEPDLNAAVESAMETALVRVRQEMERTRPGEMGWRDSFVSDDDERRKRGKQLFQLALAYVLKPLQRNQVLADGRRLGYEYGAEAAANGISLVQTGRAVQFFRGQLVAGLRGQEGGTLDADDVRIQRLLDHFLDEVLYAVLDGYEHGALDIAG
jgi:excisionase family DNA binding protein